MGAGPSRSDRPMRENHLGFPSYHLTLSCRQWGMTDATLLRGWLGMFSFFIAPVTALINVVNLSKLTSLPAPDPNSSVRPPADPGQGLFRRPGVYVYVGVIAIVLVYFVLVLSR